MYAVVRCICGKENKLNNFKSKKCRCGVVLRVEFEPNDVIPHATVPDGYNHMEYDQPIITEFTWDGEDIYLYNGLVTNE
jgi:hypothetical protein